MISNRIIKLSIIIPLYNLQDYITSCLSSIYSQQVDDELFEVIIVDDGSKDKSVERIEPFMAKHRNLKLIKQTNQGVSVARNSGLQNVVGKYVTFLDGDDKLQQGSLLKTLQCLEDSTADLIYLRSQLDSSYTQELHNWMACFREGLCYSAFDLLKHGYNNCGSVTAGLYRLDFLKYNRIEFAPGVANSEDAIFNYLLYSHNPKVFFFNIRFYCVTIRQGSAHHNFTLERAERFKNNFLYLDKLLGSGALYTTKSILDLAYYQTISQASNMCVKCGVKNASEIKRIIGWTTPHKLNYKYFTTKQLLKVFIINHFFSLYIKLLQNRI